MAESLPGRDAGDLPPDVRSESPLTLECAVCLQTCVHPAELPCGHVFCYLCIKGIVNRNRRCAMCRQSIPPDFLDKPRLLKPVETYKPKGINDGHAWYYEGLNGWWQYDERTSTELESAYQSGVRCVEILVAGYIYVADFDSMLQYRRSDTSKRRRIKRDLITTNKKGVAGLKIMSTSASSNIVSNVLVPGMENLHISNRAVGIENQIGDAMPQNISRQSSDDTETDTLSSTGHSLSPLLPAYSQDGGNLSESEVDPDEYLENPNINGSFDWSIRQMGPSQAQQLNNYQNPQHPNIPYQSRSNLRGYRHRLPHPPRYFHNPEPERGARRNAEMPEQERGVNRNAPVPVVENRSRRNAAFPELESRPRQNAPLPAPPTRPWISNRNSSSTGNQRQNPVHENHRPRFSVTDDEPENGTRRYTRFRFYDDGRSQSVPFPEDSGGRWISVPFPVHEETERTVPLPAQNSRGYPFPEYNDESPQSVPFPDLEDEPRASVPFPEPIQEHRRSYSLHERERGSTGNNNNNTQQNNPTTAPSAQRNATDPPGRNEED